MKLGRALLDKSAGTLGGDVSRSLVAVTVESVTGELAKSNIDAVNAGSGMDNVPGVVAVLNVLQIMDLEAGDGLALGVRLGANEQATTSLKNEGKEVVDCVREPAHVTHGVVDTALHLDDGLDNLINVEGRKGLHGSSLGLLSLLGLLGVLGILDGLELGLLSLLLVDLLLGNASKLGLLLEEGKIVVDLGLLSGGLLGGHNDAVCGDEHT